MGVLEVLLVLLIQCCAVCNAQDTRDSTSNTTSYRISGSDIQTDGYTLINIPEEDAYAENDYIDATEYLPHSTQPNYINGTTPTKTESRRRLVTGARCLNLTYAANGTVTVFVVPAQPYYPIRLGLNPDDWRRLAVYWNPSTLRGSSFISLDPSQIYAIVYFNPDFKDVEYVETSNLIATACPAGTDSSSPPVSSQSQAPSAQAGAVPTLFGYANLNTGDYDFVQGISNVTCIAYQLQVYPQGSKEIDVSLTVTPMDKAFFSWYGEETDIDSYTNINTIAVKQPAGYFSEATNNSLTNLALNNPGIVDGELSKYQNVIAQAAVNNLDPTQRYTIVAQVNPISRDYLENANNTVFSVRQAGRSSGKGFSQQYSNSPNPVL